MLFLDASSSLRRYRARVLYDGSAFTGFQTQPNKRAVADVLQVALAECTRQQVSVNGASRTDAGVHARGQAIHFDLAQGRNGNFPSGEALARSLNALCPPELRVSNVEEAPETDKAGRLWHARLWATGKLYSYRLSTGRCWDPLEVRSRHHAHHLPLDLDAMNAASGHLLGKLDCAAFANRRAGEPPPRELDRVLTTRIVRDLRVVDEGGGNLRADFHVQSALFKMVRNMVGLLIAVGTHKIGPADVPGLVASRDRDLLPPPAPAHGLTLESVYYLQDQGWAGRFTHPLHASARVCDGPEECVD